MMYMKTQLPSTLSHLQVITPFTRCLGHLKKLMKNYQIESIQYGVWDKQTFLELWIMRLWFSFTETFM